MKNLWPNKNDSVKKETVCQIKSPWIIEEIRNGLKARVVKEVRGVFIKNIKGEILTNKKISVHYFEYDRILGRNAFKENGVLKVMEMFDELKKNTPLTLGYIFKENIFLNFKRGILKRSNKTGEEDFFSEETLRNESLDNYLQLSCSTDPLDEKTDTDREEVHNQCTDLQSSTSSR